MTTQSPNFNFGYSRILTAQITLLKSPNFRFSAFQEEFRRTAAVCSAACVLLLACFTSHIFGFFLFSHIQLNQECVSEYISFITGEANERCQREQRKTITAEDVLWAMSKLGFDDYIEPLTLYLHRYRELEGERGSIRTCEPLLKLSRAAMDQYTAFGPVFHIGPPPSHHPGYFGGPTSVNGYLKEASDTAGPSQSPTAAAGGPANSVTSFEPYGHHK